MTREEAIRNLHVLSTVAHPILAEACTVGIAALREQPQLYYSQKSKRVVSDPTATKEYGCFRDPGYVHHSWIDDLEPL